APRGTVAAGLRNGAGPGPPRQTSHHKIRPYRIWRRIRSRIQFVVAFMASQTKTERARYMAVTLACAVGGSSNLLLDAKARRRKPHYYQHRPTERPIHLSVLTPSGRNG